MFSSETIVLDYKKPLQSRPITKKYRSYRGKVRSTKIHLVDKSHDFESGLERDLLEILDHDYFCVDIQVQPAMSDEVEPFYWVDEEGNKHKTFPDIWSIFRTGKIVLWQIKNFKELLKLETNDLWQQEVEALKIECENRGWELRIVTEKDIWNTRLANIKILRGAALNPPDQTEIEEFHRFLLHNLNHTSGFSFHELTQRARKKFINFSKNQISHLILYFLYYQKLTFNWKQPLQKNTLIHFNNENQFQLIPFYKEKSENINQTASLIDSIFIPDEKEIETAYKRYEIIKPLLEKTNRTKMDVKIRGKEFGYSTRAVYNWIKAYQEQGGIKGLFRQETNKRKRKSNYPERVEEIIIQSLEDFLGRIKKPNIVELVNEIQDQIESEGFPRDIVKYHAIAKRIRRIPAKEKFGKQGKFTRYEIPASVKGEMPTGKYPLDAIQLDHTLLDIVLVDQEYRLPIGRPWLTVGIDTNSRMIYCYYLSLNFPSSLSVTTALMMGFLPKENLLKRFKIKGTYPILGLPRQISVDNSKEFDSKHLEEFCHKFKIDIQFREIKRPDHGPFVERFFGTLNGAIKNSNIRGYAHPLKSRPNGYNPDKAAEQGGMTLPEFEEWLLRWIVNIYHQREHNTLGISPQEQYHLGLNGEGDSFGGIVKQPDTTFLKFLIMPKWREKPVLRKEGVRWKNNYYHYNEYKEIHPILKAMRKKNRGKKTRIEFRYDPRDITYIWIQDPSTKNYYPIFISKGYLKPFIDKYPNNPVSLSEYDSISRRFRQEKRKISSKLLSEGMKQNRDLVDESAKKSKRARRKKAIRARNDSLPKDIVPIKTKSIKTNKQRKKREIDWSKIKPAPKSPMARLRSD